MSELEEALRARENRFRSDWTRRSQEHQTALASLGTQHEARMAEAADQHERALNAVRVKADNDLQAYRYARDCGRTPGTKMLRHCAP